MSTKTTIENLGRVVITPQNYQDFYFMRERWQIRGVDGGHSIQVGDQDGDRARECQNQVDWEHGLYADEDPPRGESHNQWDEAHAMVLMMRAAPDMLKLLFKLQEHLKKEGARHPIHPPLTQELVAEIDVVILRAQTEDKDEPDCY